MKKKFIGYWKVIYKGQKSIFFWDGYEWMSPVDTHIDSNDNVIMIEKIDLGLNIRVTNNII